MICQCKGEGKLIVLILVVLMASQATGKKLVWNNQWSINDWSNSANWNPSPTSYTDELTSNDHIWAGISELEVIDEVIHISTWDFQSDSAVTFYEDISSPGDFFSAGTVRLLADYDPGLIATAASFGGDVVFSSATTLEIELDGLLDLVFIDGFEPQLGNTFDIPNFKAANLSGTFHIIGLSGLSGTWLWDMSPLYVMRKSYMAPKPVIAALSWF